MKFWKLCKFAPVIANLAQLVEQLIRNEQAAGSSPAIGSSHFLKPLYISAKVFFVTHVDEDSQLARYY